MKDETGSGRRPAGRLKARAGRVAVGFGRWLAGAQEAYYMLTYVLLLSMLALGVFAFTRPASRLIPVEVTYEQIGLFAYTGTAPEGVYDQRQVKSGAVIFPAVTCEIDLVFVYHLVSSSESAVNGSYHLTAQVVDRNGWHRSIEIQPETTFQGNHFQVEGTINFCELQEMVDQVQQITRASASSYQVVIKPDAEIIGEIGDVVVTDTFSPELVFNLNREKIFLVDSGNEAQSNPLQPSKQGLATDRREVANTLSIFSLELDVVAARWISVLGGLAALALIGWGSYTLSRSQRQDPRVLVELLTGQPAVEVRLGNEPAQAPQLMELDSLQNLARIATSLGAVVLVYEDEVSLHFLVRDVTTEYRYQMAKHGLEQEE